MTEPNAPAPHLLAHRHSLLEDAFAMIFGALMCALGVVMLQHAGLITGQTAGLSVLISYLGPLSFGAAFFLLNLPFYLLALLRMGWRFVLKTAVAVGLVSGFVELAPQVIMLDTITPWAAALLAGACQGAGLLALFRHGASLGGVGILAFFLQERYGIRAGYVQFGFDAVLFAGAFLVLPAELVLWSLLGAAVINGIVAINHRGDLYIGR